MTNGIEETELQLLRSDTFSNIGGRVTHGWDDDRQLTFCGRNPKGEKSRGAWLPSERCELCAIVFRARKKREAK
jgi:hypothetical protein